MLPPYLTRGFSEPVRTSCLVWLIQQNAVWSSLLLTGVWDPPFFLSFCGTLGASACLVICSEFRVHLLFKAASSIWYWQHLCSWLPDVFCIWQYWKKRFVWIPQLNAHKINGQNVVWWLEMANTQNSALPLHVVEYMVGDCGYFVFNPPASFNVSTEVQGASYFSLSLWIQGTDSRQSLCSLTVLYSSSSVLSSESS